MKISRKGFTLIELLAALVILGLLMAIAAPNIMSLLNNQKNTMYLEDAKKLASAAAYKVRGNTTDENIKKPGPGQCTLMDLSFLDNGDFNDPPQGGAYFSNLSYVLVCNSGGTYKYFVQLIECKDVNSSCSQTSCTCNTSGKDRGVILVNITEFDKAGSKSKDFIDSRASAKNNPKEYTSVYTDVTDGCSGGCSLTYICTAGHPCNAPGASWDAGNNVLYDANDK